MVSPQPLAVRNSLKWTVNKSFLRSVRDGYMATGDTADALGEEWKVLSSGSVWE